ncbi:hypothetical protein [Jatrophihabitans sp.]|uniref:hypothetical protein n=1 Tax=Jatrophihabitans sp. TaxID=1932789 RepID=UPI0030C672A2
MLVVHSHPAEGEDREFNQWYEQVHLPEVLQIEGFVSATRLRAVPSHTGQLPDQPYLTVYEIEAESIEVALAALAATAPTLRMSPAIGGMASYAYSVIEPANAAAVDGEAAETALVEGNMK